MQVEKWDDFDQWLVYDQEKAIIVQDQSELADQANLAHRIADQGEPINDVRWRLERMAVERKVKTEPLDLSRWFHKQGKDEEAERIYHLRSNQPTHNYKQIKNEMNFFGQSFLEGFLGFYGLEVNNALDNYQKQLHVLEQQDLNSSEKHYYIAQAKNGEVQKAAEVPTRTMAEEEIEKFYANEPEQEEKQAQGLHLVQTRNDKD